MPHIFEYDNKIISNLDRINNRFKNSININKLIKWVENFESDEIKIALDLLRFIEYIDYDEFFIRIEEQFNQAVKNIDKNDKIVIYPFGKIGKSSTILTYPLKKTKAFKLRENNITIIFDIEHLKEEFKSDTHIIFIDDFIGTGETFIKDLKKINYKISQNSIEFKSYKLVSTILMYDGKKYIEDELNILKLNVEIYSELRYKFFDESHSIYNLYNNGNELKRIVGKYGSRILVGNPNHTPYLPFGYKESQSMIVYFYNTPNNTLSIFWGSNKGWNDLFPRDQNIKLRNAKKLRKEIHYFLSISDNLKFDLKSLSSLVNDANDERTEIAQSRKRQNHSIVLYLFLKHLNYEDVIICQILAITIKNLNDIKIEAYNKKLLKRNKNDLTILGEQLIKKMKTILRRNKIRNEKKQNFEIKNELYLPQTFKGKI